MHHCDVFAQKLDGLLEKLIPVIHIVQIQHVHRVEEHLEVMAADLIKHPAAGFRIIDAVAGHRLDGKDDAELFSAADDGLVALDEEGQGLVLPALRAELVFPVRGAGLGAHHAAAEKRGEADMGVVLFLCIPEVFLVRVQKIEVIADDGNVDAVGNENAFQIICIARGQSSGRTGQVLEELAQGQMAAGKALLPDEWQELLYRQLLGVVQTQAKLNHASFLLIWYAGAVR